MSSMYCVCCAWSQWRANVTALVAIREGLPRNRNRNCHTEDTEATEGLWDCPLCPLCEPVQFSVDEHRGADLDLVVEVAGGLVGHADAAVRDVLAQQLGVVGAVDGDPFAQEERGGAEHPHLPALGALGVGDGLVALDV